MKKIILACDEANHVCDKSQYKEASLWEKIKLNIHLIYCKACRQYSGNNAKLTKLINSSKKKSALNSEEKSNLQSLFEKELSNQN